MRDDDNGKMKLTIKEDKIIDILMHTATREELQSLGNRLDSKIEQIDAKIDKMASREELQTLGKNLNDRIDHIANRLDEKIENVANHLDKKIENVANRLDEKIENVANRLDEKIGKTATKDEMQALGHRVDQLDQRMDKNFKWVAGLIIVGILVPILMHFIK